ncbi:hypothetical protein ACFX15_020760 [Malus domestica]
MTSRSHTFIGSGISALVLPPRKAWLSIPSRILTVVEVGGCDCLGYIKYFDANLTNFTAGVETIENCVCLHEEDHGILWKHQDWRTSLAEDGHIEAEVKLLLSVGALQPGETRTYGTTIAPGLICTRASALSLFISIAIASDSRDQIALSCCDSNSSVCSLKTSMI